MGKRDRERTPREKKSQEIFDDLVEVLNILLKTAPDTFDKRDLGIILWNLGVFVGGMIRDLDRRDGLVDD